MSEKEHDAAADNSIAGSPRDILVEIGGLATASFSAFLFLIYIINTPPDLRGAMQVWRHTWEVLLAVRRYLRTTLKSEELAVLIRPLRWILRHPAPQELAAKIVQGAEAKAKRARKRLLQSVPPSPLRSSFSEHSLFSCLWTSHATERLQSRFRVMQAHFLVAHARVMRAHFPIEAWLKNELPNHRFFRWLYEPGFQIRCFSEPRGPWDRCLREAALSLLPLDCTIADYPARLRAVAESISQAETFFTSEISEEAKALGYGRSAPTTVTAESDGMAGEGFDRYLVSSGLRRFVSFLEWGLKPVQREPRKGHGKGGNKKGGTKAVGGTGDVTFAPSVVPVLMTASREKEASNKNSNHVDQDDDSEDDREQHFEIGVALPNLCRSGTPTTGHPIRPR